MSASDPFANHRNLPDPNIVRPCAGRDLGPQTPPRPTETPACAGARDGSERPDSPRRPPRPHEWTPARMAAFLDALRATQSVSRAARAVGMGRQSAYKLKRRMAGQPFAEAWDSAVAELRLESSPAPFMGRPRACPVCGSAPGRW